MSVQVPKIDTRTYADIVAQTESLAAQLSGWQPRPADQPDAGRALIRIFGRLAELALQRINQAPEKNFLAFLNLIGVQALPSQPARVPLTFQLVANSPVDAFVPQGAQVAAPPAEGEENDIIFETERDLVVTRSKLVAVFVREADADTYSDRTAEAAGAVDGAFKVFSGDQALEHSLYLACDSLFTLPAPKTVTLTFNSPDVARLVALPMRWEYWTESGWLSLSLNASTVTSAQWQLTITSLPALDSTSINEVSARWIRARLDMPLPQDQIEKDANDPSQIRLRRQDLKFDSILISPPSGIVSVDPQRTFDPFPDKTSRVFYLSLEEAFIRAGATVTINVDLEREPDPSNDLKLRWAFARNKQAQELGQSGPTGSTLGVRDFAFDDGTRAFTQSGAISFTAPLNWERETFLDQTRRWLRVEISAGSYSELPRIKSLTLRYTWTLPRIEQITIGATVQRSGLAPDLVLANTQSLDLSKDFYPFGERPRFNDTLYLRIHETLAQPGAKITLQITLTPSLAVVNGGAKLAWEVWNGATWVSLTVTDTTANFTTSGQVTFTLPEVIGVGEVNDESGCWVRARLVAGSYETEAVYKTVSVKWSLSSGEVTSTDYSVLDQPARFGPPSIQSLQFDYDLSVSKPSPPSACFTYNDFKFADCTAVAAQAKMYFTPFEPTPDSESALYLGFDQPFSNRPLTLYARAEPPLPGEVSVGKLLADETTEPPQVSWEYAGSSGWLRLGAQDETRAFIERGLIRFVGPHNFTSRSLFGQTRYWLRARWQSGRFLAPPRLRRLQTNTTWASQVTTIQNEVLGSSNGNPGQRFRAAQAPVLAGQVIEVREPDILSPEERNEIERLQGPEAITPVLNDAGQVEAAWIRWCPVPDFHHSGSRDRHYVFDHLTGEVIFGDGQFGLAPPQGQNNVRAARYRVGGGERGNVAAGAIVQLKSSWPYVESAVNLEAAGGGDEAEPLDRVKERGPKVLRHRNRTVTAQDFEDLAYEASPDVAQARAVVAAFPPLQLWLDPGDAPTEKHREVNAGRVGVVIVPWSDSPRPVPSLELIEQVQNHIRARCTPTLDCWVAGPQWIGITVEAAIAPLSMESADTVVVAVTAALEKYLHPLTGGETGEGWAFGRKPYLSDLYSLIESVPGVDYVRSLTIKESGEAGEEVAPEQCLIYSGAHNIYII